MMGQPRLVIALAEVFWIVFRSCATGCRKSVSKLLLTFFRQIWTLSKLKVSFSFIKRSERHFNWSGFEEEEDCQALEFQVVNVPSRTKGTCLEINTGGEDRGTFFPQENIPIVPL